MSATSDLLIDSIGTRAYEKDVPLLESLGLRTTGFKYAGSYLGEVVFRNEVGVITATVDVSVSAMPAQFWKFEIRSHCEDVHDCVIETGSGTFADYWPTAKLAAEGALVFSPFKGAK